MTTTEFSNEFDIHYNSIATSDAPALDLYEKSVYLTKAQLELVKNYFNPKGNKYKEGFEGSGKRRADLRQLVKPATSTLKVENEFGISDDSQFFLLKPDVFIIVQESAVVLPDPNLCLPSTRLDVVPKTHDEYNTQKDNPFKEPYEKLIWRLDIEDQQASNKTVELISPYNIQEYRYRYIEFPTPIILTDLSAAYPSEVLTIDGKSQEATSQLDQSVHREILDRAVELALGDYRPERVATKTQLDLRNE